MTISWQLAMSGPWSSASNWSPAQVPGINDDALVSASGNYLITLGTVTVNTLTIDDADALLQAFGPLTVNNGLVIAAGTLLAQDGLTTNGLSNAGSVNVSGGSLVVSGSYDTGSLNRVSAANTAVLLGTLNNVGQTLTIPEGGELGTINGGTIVVEGFVETGVLNNVAVDGALNVVNSTFNGNGLVQITNGLTVSGSAGTGIGSIYISAGVLEFTGDQSLDSVNVEFGYGSLLADNNLTLESGVSIDAQFSGGEPETLGGVGTVLNKGFIGQTVIGNEDVTPFGISVSDFENQGTIELTGALNDPLHGQPGGWNPGYIVVTSPTFDNRVDGQIVMINSDISITSSNGVTNNGTMTAMGSLGGTGSIYIGGILTGSGILKLGEHSQIELASSVGSGQTIDFVGGGSSVAAEVRVDLPQLFSGTIDGFAHGDTIDLTGVDPASVTLSGGVLQFDDGEFALSLGSGATGVQAVASGDGAEVTALCFCVDTLIRTPSGDVAVQDLTIGDNVLTLNGETRRVMWIGTGKVLTTRDRRGAATPMIVRKGALSENVPNRDLYVTKGHALYLDGVLIPVEYLVNHSSIAWDDRAREVELYHVELETHDVLIANGAPAESYRDDGNRWLFQNANTGWKLAPKEPCARLLTGGPAVDAIWRRLRDRAGARPNTLLTSDPDLHLLVDGARIDAFDRSEARYVFRLGARPRTLRIRSRSAAPLDLGITRDPRVLGVAIRRIVLAQARRQRMIEADAGSLTDGYHAFEPDVGYRWTKGDAPVPPELFAGMHGPSIVTLQLGCSAQYVRNAEAERAA